MQEILSKFDEYGRRITSVVEGIHYTTNEEKQSYIDSGYIETSEEDWNYYIGNHGEGENGTGYIRDPNTGKPIPAPPLEPTLDELKQDALSKAYNEFVRRRDAITWVERNGALHGYDRQPEDITNFSVALKRAELGAGVYYNVYVDTEDNKEFLEHTKEMFYETLNQSADEQIEAYMWFKEIKERISNATNKEELETITQEITAP